jgi:hypothetical protein
VTPVEWSAILALVGGAVDLAIRVAQAIQAGGGCVNGCPIDLATLAPADIPTGERGLDAMARAEARGRGLDDEGIAARRSGR